MKTVLNFSHPLSKKAKAQLVERLGEINEVIVPCQVDLSSPLIPQLSALIDAGHQALFDAGVRNGNDSRYSYPDLIIPPAWQFAAAYIGANFLNGEDASLFKQHAQMIVLKRNDAIPPQFELADVVYC